ncbi:hypothetical protein J1N35_013647 [Gossypium stocksii]|uniref:Uncharacterized protein n=1 Tax=Gossypium stocksii TaxID=47602 RepID=A0A9D4A911_9ROSI|nr:hypothetical protein J1N35_013647 [Gossypium stocksii]
MANSTDSTSTGRSSPSFLTVDVLLGFKSRQTRAVNNVPFHAHLVKATTMTLVEDFVHGGRPSSGAHRHGF